MANELPVFPPESDDPPEHAAGGISGVRDREAPDRDRLQMRVLRVGQRRDAAGASDRCRQAAAVGEALGVEPRRAGLQEHADERWLALPLGQCALPGLRVEPVDAPNPRGDLSLGVVAPQRLRDGLVARGDSLLGQAAVDVARIRLDCAVRQHLHQHLRFMLNSHGRTQGPGYTPR